MSRTEVISRPYLTRRKARRLERELTARLDPGVRTTTDPDEGIVVPAWAHGVRVERAGLFQHVLVATQHRGH